MQTALASDVSVQGESPKVIVIELPKIRPKETVCASSVAYFGAVKPVSANLQASVYADNLGAPQNASLEVVIDTQTRPALSIEDLKSMDSAQAAGEEQS